MKTRGFAALSATSKLETYAFERRDLGAHDIAIEIAFAGICHSDIHQVRQEWGPSIYPMVPGHEIAGVVSAIGTSVTKFVVGQRAGVGVFIDSCRQCPPCVSGLEQYCENGMTGTYNNLERDGSTVAMGGYSNNFVVDENYAVTIPQNLSLSGAAPLLCAGITLYSPLKHWGATKNTKVGIMGLGGLGHMGVKFAKALGAHVTVFSHSPGKALDAKMMGADEFVTDASEFKALHRSFDLILNTVSADIDINRYINLLNLDGTLVAIGLPMSPYLVRAGGLLSARRSLAGSTIGGIAEIQEMLDFCGEHLIESDVEIINADYINEAYDRTVASDVKYRFVIDATTF
jgi:uncharacterized zinc-type alcohol dehydrogenase-like protein